MGTMLQDKVALITGGTSGIGLATARRFIDEGAIVTVTGSSEESVAQARSELGDAATILVSDTADEAQTEALFEQIRQAHGRLDVLFLNAGIASSRRSRPVPWRTSSGRSRSISVACGWASRQPSRSCRTARRSSSRPRSPIARDHPTPASTRPPRRPRRSWCEPRQSSFRRDPYA